ncbi:MAG: hypothetical protein ACRC7N_19510 [Clostridium sp.]
MENKLIGLNSEEILKELYNKELKTKKTILEYIDILRKNKETLSEEQLQESYTLVYNKIEDMIAEVKTNTILHLKNQLKSNLGKFVKDKDPKKSNNFIEFFKEAYPKNNRKKDFTYVLMDFNRITEEQIWTTLTYINSVTLKDRRLSTDEKNDIVPMVERLLNSKKIKVVNQMKSLTTLHKSLGIEVVNGKMKNR